jgi:NAD(P)-dependent dehydrogenase (short-subunit alcohol dehydrogenase family)
MQRFADKVVLVTGAASGIGQATAFRVANEGATVVCVDRQEEALNATVQKIREQGEKAAAIVCDIADVESVKRCVQKAVEDHGKLNALCNIAGVLRMQNTLDVSLEDWNSILQINLTGTFMMCQAAIPQLLETRGNIVNMTSTAALGAHAWCAAYAASKGGVMALTKTLTVEFGKLGLNANSVSPASVKTPMSGSGNVTFPEGADLSLLDRCRPFDGVFRPPSDVASLVAFLASDEAVHINGIDIRIDGGMMV